MKEQPRVLIFTVTAWNSKVGSNTWSTLLEGYPSDKLANICIRDEHPDSNVCSRYFRISENRVIKSIFKRSIKTGEEIGLADEQNNSDLNKHNYRYQVMKKNRRYSMLMVRELIWKFGKWKTKELNNFLDDFKPDIILHSMEGYIHLNRIIEYAIDRTGAKAIGYIWDDNFTYKQSSDIGYKVYRFFQRKSLKRLAKKTREFFAISPFTKKEADTFFNIDCHLLTKPLLCEPIAKKFKGNYPIKMLYTGSLIIGRDRSLLRLSEALQKVNQEKLLLEVDVYTQTKLSDDILNKIQNKYCHIHMPISQSEALKKQNEADVLLFLEDIDGKDAKVARLSFSTKITDYLSTGKCIFAIGNKDTAPMQYFIENDAALICGSDKEILCNLMELCSNSSRIDEFAEKACVSALKYHEKNMILEKFYSLLQEVYEVSL